MWAAGVEASPLATELAKATGAELDRAGRIAVLPDLTIPGHPEVFVVGDMMALDKLPGVAEVAMQGGLHAANTIVRRLKGQHRNPFKYRDLGSAATIGRFRSVVDFRGLRLSGFPGWVIWAFVHLAFLTGFGNRLSTLLKWTRVLHRPGSARAGVQRHAYGRGSQPAVLGQDRRAAPPSPGRQLDRAHPRRPTATPAGHGLKRAPGAPRPMPAQGDPVDPPSDSPVGAGVPASDPRCAWRCRPS